MILLDIKYEIFCEAFAFFSDFNTIIHTVLRESIVKILIFVHKCNHSAFIKCNKNYFNSSASYLYFFFTLIHFIILRVYKYQRKIAKSIKVRYEIS